jgi:hypothetical protein
MKNDNTLILGLILALFLIELSNQFHYIKTKKQLNQMQNLMTQYFEPLPDINFEEEPQDGRTQ